MAEAKRSVSFKKLIHRFRCVTLPREASQVGLLNLAFLTILCLNILIKYEVQLENSISEIVILPPPIYKAVSEFQGVCAWAITQLCRWGES